MESSKKRTRESSTDEEGEAEEYEKLSEYELLQRRNIKERNEFLQKIGIKDIVSELKTYLPQKNQPREKKKSRNFENLPRREPSRRLRGLEIKSIQNIEEIKEEQKVEIDSRLQGTVSLELEEEESDLLKNLLIFKENCKYNPDLDISSCNLEQFKNNIGSLEMLEPRKVTSVRIQSLCIHPVTSKQIILAGAVNGELGIWDVTGKKDNGVIQLQHQKAPLNCISVDRYCPNKVYTTSHEGSVCCTDLDRKQCSSVYNTDYTMRINHLTWHEQISSNVLLIAHGDGSVGTLDLREDNMKRNISWFNCFERSARTVQLHPRHSDYFLVSSGYSKRCRIFDLRTSKNCVADLPHPKGLSSAFFSPNGNEILTTSFDDRLRIFDCSSFKTALPKQKCSIVHNNFTGRWLSVFKAVWFPYRNDLFTVGSLLSPRRIEIYQNDGRLFYNLADEQMSTISSVIAFHPALPIIAGGNSSGKLHVFVPPSS